MKKIKESIQDQPKPEEPNVEEKPEEPKVEAKPGGKAKYPLKIDYTNVRCGLSTIHDLHRRITILERKLGFK